MRPIGPTTSATAASGSGRDVARRTDRQQDTPCADGHYMPRVDCASCAKIAPKRKPRRGQGKVGRCGHVPPEFGCQHCAVAAHGPRDYHPVRTPTKGQRR